VKKDWSHLEEYRVIIGPMKSLPGRHEGAFRIRRKSFILSVIAFDSVMIDKNDKEDWEKWDHVSVSLETRCPNWEEMNAVKMMFWEDWEIAVQFHPKLADYVNKHPYCLHLWSHPTIAELGTPPKWMVG